MSDQRDCTHPTPRTISTTPGAELGPPAAFREALLWRLENPTATLLLRRFGEVLFEIVDEAGQFGPDPDAHGLTRPALHAAAHDLFHTARDLSEVALSGEASTLGPPDTALAHQAEVWAARVTTLAAEIRRAAGSG